MEITENVNNLPQSEELLQRLNSSGDLVTPISDDLFQQNNLRMNNHQDDSNSSLAMDNEIIMHMDIREPLKRLQKLLERKVGITLTGYKFWLQDAQELEPHKNLVDQCVKGEGLVQINVEINYIMKRINILDVLKPTDDALEALASSNVNGIDLSMDDDDFSDGSEKLFSVINSTIQNTSIETSDEKPCLNWVLDETFRKEQTRLKMPFNPNEWTLNQVNFWFNWAVKKFDLTVENRNDWALTGTQLCALSHEEFRKKLSKDPGNIFWTHLQLLKECKFVAVVHDAFENDLNSCPTFISPREPKIMRKAPYTLKKDAVLYDMNSSSYGPGSGNNGQVQLWQFLLEILTDPQHVNIIQWVGNNGEFKLTDPEGVARLWGEKKNKPAMNYEKLSRALRYYYDGDMISKVAGKRFTYKFDCDLKLLIGYTANELCNLVNEGYCSDKSIEKSLEYMSTFTKQE